MGRNRNTNKINAAMKIKVKISDLTHEYKANFILISFLCSDGSLIKKKYINYKLSECKKLFLNEFINILN